MCRRVVPGLFAAVMLAAGAAPGAFPSGRAYAQEPNPSSAENPFWGSVTAQPVSVEPLQLSLDDAIQRGLKNNLGLKEAENAQMALEGEKNEALQEFLPTIALEGDTGYYMHDLAALGFSPKVVGEFKSFFPGGKAPTNLSLIARDDLTEGQIRYSQILFSGPVIAAWKAAGAAERSAYFAKMTARGEVVQQVAEAYLRAMADASEVENAKALVAQAQVLENHAQAEHEAGTAANLELLRAQVQLQAQQQTLIQAQNQQAKDLILLKREIGVDPDQEIALTDQAPYSELAAQTPEEVRAEAYQISPGLPEPAEPGGRIQSGVCGVSQRAVADVELLQLLRHQHRKRRGYAWQLYRGGPGEFSDLPRSQAARR